MKLGTASVDRALPHRTRVSDIRFYRRRLSYRDEGREAELKRRRALEIIGAASTAPIIWPNQSLAELIAFGQQARSDFDAGGAVQSVALTPDQIRLVSALADVILPATETPAASDVGVIEFIDSLVAGWLDDSERGRFLTGLNAIDPAAEDKYGVAFADCTAEQQHEFVEDLDQTLDAARVDESRDETELFFYDMKRFALAGFFTSEPGLRSLGYRIVPGAFEGCVLIDQYGAGTDR